MKRFIKTYKTRGEYEADKVNLTSPYVASIMDEDIVIYENEGYLNNIIKELLIFEPETMVFKPKSDITSVDVDSSIAKVVSNLSNLDYCFSSCYSLTSISLPALPLVTSMSSCFYNCTSLTSINLPELPLVTNMSYCFSNCTSLQNLNIGSLNSALSNITVWCLSNCTKLTVDSLVNVLNALPSRTGTNKCTIGTTNLNKLTADQKAIATNKGWTLN